MPVAVSKVAFDPIEALAAFEAANISSGASASFVGRCRGISAGAPVQALELQHYPDFTETIIERFQLNLVAQLELDDVLVIHRVGFIAPGEAIVLVAACSAHRTESLRGVETLIDFLKTDAPFWKREITNAGARWIEPCDADHLRRAAAGRQS